MLATLRETSKESERRKKGSYLHNKLRSKGTHSSDSNSSFRSAVRCSDCYNQQEREMVSEREGAFVELEEPRQLTGEDHLCGIESRQYIVRAD